MRRSIVCILFLIAFGSAGARNEAHAQGVQFSAQAAWWLTGVNGDVRLAQIPYKVDVGIGSGDVKYGVDVRGELDWGDWAAAVDLSFLGVETPVSFVHPSIGSVAGDLNYDLFMGELIALRSVAGQPEGLEVIFGFRFSSLDTDVAYMGTDESGGALEELKWFDPIFGVRASSPEDRDLFGTFRADIGGFGIGSNLTFNAVAKGGYRVSRVLSLEAAVKFMSVDYEGDEVGFDAFLYDVNHFGFLFGVGIAP